MAFDLEDSTGTNKNISLDAENLPTGRASDLLRQGLPPQNPKLGPVQVDEFMPSGTRPEIPGDNIFEGIFWLLSVISGIGVIYLFCVLWMPNFADPLFTQHFSHDDRLRIVGNISLVEQIIRFTIGLGILVALYLYYDSAVAGYAFLGVAILAYFGVPFMTDVILGWTHSTAGPKTTLPVLDFFKATSAWPAVPGVLLIFWDILRRTINAMGRAQATRATLRYGRNIGAQAKKRNVFLGYCYNMPFCRESIRVKCPVYTKKIKPCWQYKVGCMCEESISVLATAPNWKAAVAVATAKMEGRTVPIGGTTMQDIAAGKLELTWEEKKQRCRECVIYNTHQEQKYKLLSAISVGGTVLILWQFNAEIIGLLSNLFNGFNSALTKLALTSNPNPESLTFGSSNTLEWAVLIVVTIMALSKILQIIEYCCFKIKI